MKLTKFSMQKMSVTELNAIKAGSNNSNWAGNSTVTTSIDTLSSQMDPDASSVDSDTNY